MSQTNVLAVASDKGVQLWRIPEAKLITSLIDVDTNSVAISDDDRGRRRNKRPRKTNVLEACNKIVSWHARHYVTVV